MLGEMELSALSAAGSGKEPLDGTLVLEHAYDVGSRLWSGSLHATYQGTQRPFDRPVHIRVYHRLDPLGLSLDARVRLQTHLESGGVGGWALDYGEVGPDMPFLVLAPPPQATLGDWVEHHPGSLDRLAEPLWRLAHSLDDARRCELVLANLYVADIDAPEPELVLYAIGDSLDREAVRDMTGLVQRDLVLGFPPECFTPPLADEHGLELDERADVYRVCAALYELAVGSHPTFPVDIDVAGAIAELVNPIGRRPSRAATGKPDLDALIMEGLAPVPAERLSSAVFGERIVTLQSGPNNWTELATADSANPATSPARAMPGLARAFVWVVRLTVLFLVGLGTFLLTHRPPHAVSLLVRSSPPGVQFERVAEDGQGSPVGRTPLMLSDLPIEQPVRLRPIYEDGRVGDVQTVRPDRLEDGGACRVLDVRFED